MKKRALHKDFRMELRRTFMRFMSILLIVALGVAFFSGLRACKEDMLESASDYYDQTNFFDLSVIGTWGISETDITAMKSVDGVKDVEGIYTKELMVEKDGQEFLINSFSYHNRVNTYELKDGRIPNDATECIVDTMFLTNTQYQIGDTIQLLSKEEELADSLFHTELTIVGSCYDPQYLSIFRGSGNTSNGTIDSFIVMAKENFKSDVFTQAYLIIQKDDTMGNFGELYERKVNDIQERLELISKKRCQIQFEERTKEPMKELQKAKKEYQNQSALFEQNMEQANLGLEKTAQKLQKAENSLAIFSAELETKRDKLRAVSYSERDINVMLAPEITQINEYRSLMGQAREEYESRKSEVEIALSEAKTDLEKAKRQIEEQEDKLAGLIKPQWYIGDRNWVESYVSYQSDADRIDAIAKLFPIIFFFVAALVCLTTMTRMVDEERTQIGVLKALGYSKLSIAGKFLKYACFATIAGSILGALIGQKVFPYVVINAYRILYSGLPYIVADYQPYDVILAGLLSIACTMTAAYAACMNELRATPAQLMRPVAPKPGKRILLERISVLWNSLNFTRKASLRNLLRYKKRFLMTTVGIAGCMGLIVVGFGIKDSIGIMGKLQFDELWLQDAELSLADELSKDRADELIDKLMKKTEIMDSKLLLKKSVDCNNGDISKNTTLYVFEDDTAWESYFVFRDRVTKEKVTIHDDGVILTEKYAKMLDLSVGDTIYLNLSTAQNEPVKVVGITENYLMHFMFMTKNCYKNLTGTEPEYNTCLLKTTIEEVGKEEIFLQQLADDNDEIQSQYSTRAREDRIDTMLESLNIITYVLIISAGLLAFIVLYNLSNININERKRELASLKVLGFFDGEVNSYVMRENIILTVIGILLGIVLGKVLHGFVIQTCEIDEVMFGRIIYPISYGYSAVLTMIFSLIICIFMYFKLKKIDMIESLKSVE